MAEFELLRKMDLCWGMNDNELKLLWNIATSEKYAAGQVIFQEGDPCDRLYIMVSGIVEISIVVANDVRQTLGELRRGMQFGEMALIDDVPRSATAKATEESMILSVVRDAFLDLIERNPTFAAKALVNLSRTLSKRLRMTNDALRQTAHWNLRTAHVATLSMNSLIHDHKLLQFHLIGSEKIKGYLLKMEKNDVSYDLTVQDETGQILILPYQALVYIAIEEKLTTLPLDLRLD